MTCDPFPPTQIGHCKKKKTNLKIRQFSKTTTLHNLPRTGVSLGLGTWSRTRLAFGWSRSWTGIPLQWAWTWLWFWLGIVTMAVKKMKMSIKKNSICEEHAPLSILTWNVSENAICWPVTLTWSENHRRLRRHHRREPWNDCETWIGCATNVQTWNVVMHLNSTKRWPMKKWLTLNGNGDENANGNDCWTNESGHDHRRWRRHVLHGDLQLAEHGDHSARYRPIFRWHSSCPTTRQIRQHCRRTNKFY